MDSGRPDEIESLLSEHGGDGDFVAELMGIFVERFGRAADTIEGLCAAGDYADAAKAAHALKGTAGTMRAARLFEAAKALNGALRAEYYGALAELLPKLRKELDRTVAEYREWIERRKK